MDYVLIDTRRLLQTCKLIYTLQLYKNGLFANLLFNNITSIFDILVHMAAFTREVAKLHTCSV